MQENDLLVQTIGSCITLQKLLGPRLRAHFDKEAGMILASLSVAKLFRRLAMKSLTRYGSDPLSFFDDMRDTFQSFFDEFLTLSHSGPSIDLREEKKKEVIY